MHKIYGMKIFLHTLFLFIAIDGLAQKNISIISGPMLGHTELRTAKVWIQLSKETPALYLSYQKKNDKSSMSKKISAYNQTFNTGIVEAQNTFGLYNIKFTLTALDPGTTYTYAIGIKSTPSLPLITGEFTTQENWQWRKPVPDFSFITGSCAYFNEPLYDRNAKPYGGDSSIFETMAKEKSAFMLWLGDNWYTRPADYFSEWGLNYRAMRDRSLPVLKNFLKAMPQYAIWDDHDYGPNDADKSYVLKDASRKVFMNYWSNPSYGENGQGIYTKITWNDVDVFMLDDRWFRSNDDLKDSINGQPNINKKMFGEAQMEWLKNALVNSNNNPNISFRIIATGSQVLNPLSPWDCFRHFPAEYDELMSFIEDNKINGIVFLTGDRHHSEIIKKQRQNAYTLYDITASPFTSGVAKTNGAEINNTYRVGSETDAQNYARISFTGAGKNRKMTTEFLGVKGELLGTWSILLSEISCSPEK